MRQLIFAYRHEVRSRHQDVRDLHHGVDEEPDRHALLAGVEVLHFGFQRRVALQAPERHEPRKQHGELRMLRHEALDDEVTSLRIQSDGEPVERNLPHRIAHTADVVCVVGHLVVRDQEEALVLLLQSQPVLERPRVVAEVKGTGRPDAGEDALAVGGCVFGVHGWFLATASSFFPAGDKKLSTPVRGESSSRGTTLRYPRLRRGHLCAVTGRSSSADAAGRGNGAHPVGDYCAQTRARGRFDPRLPDPFSLLRCRRISPTPALFLARLPDLLALITADIYRARV